MALPDDPVDQVDPKRGVYGISVAAELVGSAPQNLRLYEARGLVTPARSVGGTRRYSDTDLTRLRQIGQLLADGINLAGVAAVLALPRLIKPSKASSKRPATNPGQNAGHPRNLQRSSLTLSHD